MERHTALAIEHHALAICAWALVAKASSTEVPNSVAQRVDNARKCSQIAQDFDTSTDPDWEGLDAACRDAEVEHAIQEHADSITHILFTTGVNAPR